MHKGEKLTVQNRVKKGETPEQFRERVRAHVCLANTSNDESFHLAAFMAVFHPNHPEDSTRKMLHDVRERQRGRAALTTKGGDDGR